MKEKYITIEDGLDIVQMRTLLEMTQTLVKALNEEEYKEIMKVYYKATSRLLGDKNE